MLTVIKFEHILFIVCLNNWVEEGKSENRFPPKEWIQGRFNWYVDKYNLERTRCHHLTSNRKITQIAKDLRDAKLLRSDEEVRMGNTRKSRYVLSDSGKSLVQKLTKGNIHRQIFNLPIEMKFKEGKVIKSELAINR